MNSKLPVVNKNYRVNQKNSGDKSLQQKIGLFLEFNGLYEAAMPCVVPDLSRVTVHTEHTESVACFKHVDVIVAVERVNIADCRAWVTDG